MNLSTTAMLPCWPMAPKRGRFLLRVHHSPKSVLMNCEPRRNDLRASRAGSTLQELKDIVADIDVTRLESLLAASNDAARQRAAYFFRFAGAAPQTLGLPEKLRPVELGTGGRGHWDNATGVNDHLLRPLLETNAKG